VASAHPGFESCHVLFRIKLATQRCRSAVDELNHWKIAAASLSSFLSSFLAEYALCAIDLAAPPVLVTLLDAQLQPWKD